MAESEAFKKAKEAYAKAQLGSTAAGKVLKKGPKPLVMLHIKLGNLQLVKVSELVLELLLTLPTRHLNQLEKPKCIRMSLKSLMMDLQLHMVGFNQGTKRSFEKERVGKKEKLGYQGPVRENEEAGGALIATEHKATGPTMGEKWENFKLKSPVGRGVAYLQEKWEESENGLIALIRTIIEKVTGFFRDRAS